MDKINQDRKPNFRDKKGNLYLMRCFACTNCVRGRENYAPAVASGKCAWCGWKEDNRKQLLENMSEEKEVDDPVGEYGNALSHISTEQKEYCKCKPDRMGQLPATPEGLCGKCGKPIPAEKKVINNSLCDTCKKGCKATFVKLNCSLYKPVCGCIRKKGE